jgi:phosphatidylethanolamine N-methyltransferase
MPPGAGYAGYYGLSMIVGSYPVLFVSLATHAAQFAFLAFFENPREMHHFPHYIV